MPKAKAYIDLRARKEQGGVVDTDDVEKHKKDVFRLAPMLTEGARSSLPEELEADMREFVTRVAEELPNENFLRAAGLGAQRVVLTKLWCIIVRDIPTKVELSNNRSQRM